MNIAWISPTSIFPPFDYCSARYWSNHHAGVLLAPHRLYSHAQGGVNLIDPSTSAEGVQMERILRRNGYPIIAMREIDQDYEAVMQRCGLMPDPLPVVVFIPTMICCLGSAIISLLRH
jgi:hypothetical protein